MSDMEYRQLGRSGFKVPVLSFGTGTFGGATSSSSAGAGPTSTRRRGWSTSASTPASISSTPPTSIRTASRKRSSGQALKGRRDKALISTKATFRIGEGPNDVGSSRYHLIRACEASLKRLGTDHIDVYFMHGFDATTPVEETLRALDDLVTSGKIGYIGASNFSGWHLMKSLATSEQLRPRPLRRLPGLLFADRARL